MINRLLHWGQKANISISVWYNEWKTLQTGKLSIHAPSLLQVNTHAQQSDTNAQFGHHAHQPKDRCNLQKSGAEYQIAASFLHMLLPVQESIQLYQSYNKTIPFPYHH